MDTHTQTLTTISGAPLGLCRRLYVFEALFLSTINIGIQNFPISAMVTYIVIRVVRFLRGYFGQANLTRKTLIDAHFLF